MSSRSIRDRLATGERLLLDGGTGSELQRRGVDVLVGATAEGLGPWSATANVDAPGIVRQVHTDYLGVGADIVTSNSFWTSRVRLAPVGLGERWEEYARAAGELAVQARDSSNPAAYVAAGIAPPSVQGMQETRGRNDPDVVLLGEETVYRGFADQARVLAEAGADLMLPEYVGHIPDCVTAVDACASAGLPVFLGVRHVSTEGRMQYGDSIEDLIAALRGHPVDAILLMCSSPEAISATLPLLRNAFDGPIGAYPNIGYHPLAPLGAGAVKDAIQAEGYTPSRLAEFAAAWVEMGAQIVGGCCATTPEHIAALRAVVKE